MKALMFTKTSRWAALAVLAGGLVYSALALSTRPAYASSCDCVTARQKAVEACDDRDPFLFECSITYDGNTYYLYKCTEGSFAEVEPCD